MIERISKWLLQELKKLKPEISFESNLTKSILEIKADGEVITTVDMKVFKSLVDFGLSDKLDDMINSLAESIIEAEKYK